VRFEMTALFRDFAGVVEVLSMRMSRARPAAGEKHSAQNWSRKKPAASPVTRCLPWLFVDGCGLVVVVGVDFIGLVTGSGGWEW